MLVISHLLLHHAGWIQHSHLWAAVFHPDCHQPAISSPVGHIGSEFSVQTSVAVDSWTADGSDSTSVFHDTPCKQEWGSFSVLYTGSHLIRVFYLSRFLRIKHFFFRIAWVIVHCSEDLCCSNCAGVSNLNCAGTAVLVTEITWRNHRSARKGGFCSFPNSIKHRFQTQRFVQQLREVGKTISNLCVPFGCIMRSKYIKKCE